MPRNPWGNRGGGWGGGDDEEKSIKFGGILGGILQLVPGGVLRAGKTSFLDTSKGWWLGIDDDLKPKLNFGNASYHVIWDGDSLEISGTIGGDITDFLIAADGAIRAVKTSFTDTAAGWWLGIEDDVPKFNVGDDENYLQFDGTNVLVKSDLVTIDLYGLHVERREDSGKSIIFEDEGGEIGFMAGEALTLTDENEVILLVSGESATVRPHAIARMAARDYTQLHVAQIVCASASSVTYVQVDADQLRLVGAYLDLPEITAPGAPLANEARLYCVDNGAGKTELCVRFATGAVQVLATEP